MFSPNRIATMKEEELRSIAAESDAVVNERASLGEKLDNLKRGKRTLDIEASDTGNGQFWKTGKGSISSRLIIS
jgi:hypothetical protein